MRSWNDALLITLLSGVLAGCGGGGDGASAPAAPLSFAFPPPTAASFAQVTVTPFTVSGDCSGSAVKVRAVLTPGTFEGRPASAVATRTDRILANCAAAGTTSTTQTAYYDAAFGGIGIIGSSGTELVSDAPVLPPATMKVGDAGSFGSAILYSDSAKTKIVGRVAYSYAVQAETPTTALAILTTVVKDPAGNLLETETTTYRLRLDASPLLLSIDDQFAAPGTLHLLYTPASALPTLAAGATS